VKDESAAVNTFLSSLVSKGYLKNEETAALREKYKNVGELYDALLEVNEIPPEKLAEVFALAVNMPYVNLKLVDEKAFDLVDQENAKKYGFIPFYRDENARLLQVALLDPVKFSSLNRSAIDTLEKKLGLSIEFFIAPHSAEKRIFTQVSTPTSAQNQNKEAAKAEPATKSSEPAAEKPFEPVALRFDPGDIPEEILRKIPLDIAEKYKAVAFRSDKDGAFDIAISDPHDSRLREIFNFVEQKSGIKLNLIYADLKDIEATLKRYEQIGKKPAEPDLAAKSSDSQNPAKQKQPQEENPDDKKSQDIQVEKKEQSSPLESEEEKDDANDKTDVAMENPDLAKFIGKENVTVEDLKAFVNAGQVPQAVASIIFLASVNRASDIHIEPYEKAVRVRFRIDGELNEVILMPAELNAGVAARIKILAKLKIDEQRVPQDGRIEIKVKDESIDVRISTLPTVFGEKVVMRLLSKSKKLQDLAELGLDGLSFDRISKAMNKPYGIILATGPTGSGKSTTLYAILTRLNKPQTNIVTLEDPVEYEIQGINQVQVKPQIGFSFAEGLRSVLRQDPNVVMVGEIRDKETAELATQAALTGHLVLSTLHTNNSAGALPRMSNLGVEPFLLTSAVNVVVGQRLVRRVCPKCREETSVPQSVIYEVKKQFERINFSHPMKFFKGKGCSECKNGFRGRIGLYEVLEMSGTIENLVLEKKSAEDIFAQAVKEGMITMRQDGLIKAVKGLTTVDEVLRATSETKEG